MTSKPTRPDADPQAEARAANGAAEDAAAEATAAEDQPESAAEAGAATDDPIARLEAEVAGLHDQLLRALAETENLRRRAAREREDAVRYAAAPLVKDLLGVADNLRRALESVPREAAEGDEQLQTLLTGIELTEKELNAAFERHHIERIEPIGERLDPNLHEAMFEIPAPDQAPGTVLQVIRPGYRLRDRLLRAAQVGVAKGGPSAAGGDTKPGSQVDTTA